MKSSVGNFFLTNCNLLHGTRLSAPLGYLIFEIPRGPLIMPLSILKFHSIPVPFITFNVSFITFKIK